MGREKKPDSQGTLHIPPGYVTTEGGAVNARTGVYLSVLIAHPAHTTVHFAGDDDRGPSWCITWPDLEPSGPRAADNRSQIGEWSFRKAPGCSSD